MGFGEAILGGILGAPLGPLGIAGGAALFGGGSELAGGGGKKKGEFSGDFSDNRKLIWDLMDSLGPRSDARALAHQTMVVGRSLPEQQRDALVAQLAASLPQQVIAERLAKRQGKELGWGGPMHNQKAAAKWLSKKFGKMDAMEAYTLNLARPYLEGIAQPKRDFYAEDLDARIQAPHKMSQALIRSLMAEPVVNAFDAQLKRLQGMQEQAGVDASAGGGYGGAVNPYA